MHFAWHLKKKILRIPLIFECDSEELKKYLMGNTVECDKKAGVP